MAIFKLNDLSEEKKKKYYSNLQKKMNDDFEIEKQRTMNISHENTILKNNQQSMSNEILFPTKQEKGLGDKIGYTVANLGGGILQGTTGIAQGKLTDTANNLQKGSKMSDEEAIKNAINLISPVVGKTINLIDSFKNQKEIKRDENKTGLEKAVDIGLNTIGNVKDNLDFLNTAKLEKAIGKTIPNADETVLKLNEKISEPSKNVNKYLAEESKNYDDVMNFIAGGFQSVGNMAPSIATSLITKDPNMSLATLGASVKGQATQEALNKGEDLETATKIGDAKALIEVATEKLSGGAKIFGKGSVDDLAEDLIKKGAKSKVGRFLLKQVFNAGGEIAEEEISNVLGNIIDKGTTDPDKKIIDLQEGLETMGSTAFTTTLLNILTGGMINDYKEIGNDMNQYKDYNTNEVLDNNTQNVLKQVENIINENTQTDTTQNQQNNQQQQITQQEKKVAQNENMEQINNIANNQEILYNNSNEESGANGQIQGRRMAELSEQYGTRVQQENKQQQNRQYTKQEYEKWERSIKPTEENKLTNEQIKLKDDIKRQYNKDIVFFDDENNYNAGASLTNNNKIYINSKQANTFGINKIVYHEIAESNILHNKEISNDIIKPSIEKIINDINFEQQKEEFWKNQNEDMPSDYAIAKDILCDRYAEIKSREKLDYNNLLSQETNMTIDYALDNFDKNIESKGTKTNLKEIRNKDIAPVKELNKDNDITIPTKEYFENKEQIDSLTDEDYKVLNKIYEKEGRTEVLTEKKKANLLEKYANDKYTFKDSLDILTQKIVNKGHYIDKLAEKANNLELKYAYDKNLNSFAEGQYEIGVAQTDNKGNKIGKSINEIWKPVEDSKLTKEFSEYLLHKHNIDRSGRNKFIFGEEIGPTESTKIALDLEKKHPEFKKYAEDIKKFNHNNLNSLKEAGLLTQDTIEYIENIYPNYIAISRNMEDSIYNGSNDETGTRGPLKKATGGNSDIQPIKDTMAQQVIRIKRLINQNELGKQLAKTLKNAQIDEGVDIELSPTLLMDMDTMVDTDNKGNKFYLYFEDGKQKKLRINDNLYESLRPTEISRLEKTLPVKALQKITSVHRSLLTSNNPLFIVTNFFKDFQDGMFNSKYSSKFIKNYGKALNEIWTKGKYYESYMANGGMSNTYFDYNEGIKKKSNKFLEKIRNINEIVEQLPRMSEFISTLEDGKSLNEALYNAAEITTNFKRGGDLAKSLNRNGANFLNASIQGLDKQFRNFSGQNGAKGYVNLLAKATIMSIVPSILNHMLLDGDKDYEDLPESTKDLYYLFKYDDGKFIRIPKGRVLSIFGAATRRTMEATQGNEDAFEGLDQTIVNQVAPNNPLEDNILAPITQVSNNKTWYGSDLVSSRLQKELPENQYDETTDEFSKWLGKQLKMSPKKINYLLDQYSGGIGDVLLPIITPQAKENVVVDKFTTDSVLKNKNVSKFYTTLEKQTQIANDSFATDEDSLQLKYLNSVSSEMNDLYKQKREIQMSNISNDEKKNNVREVQSKINELAEKGLENYSKITKKSNSAKVGDQEYYKDSKGSWKLLDEEEKSKLGNLSLETYSKYKQQVYKETQNKKNSGELTENQNLKDKDKIQILLDSKYSDKEIKAIYENQIKGSNDLQYDIMDKTGINIKEYLKYKQQSFESDKKDDGTLSGKTVNGSKKDKTVKYLNSMNVTGNQRLLLYALNGYTITTNQKSKLVKYVNTLELNKNQKLELYNKLSGFTVYKDGTVKYK